MTNTKTTEGTVTKEKLQSIMEAASALTALGDEDSNASAPSSPRTIPCDDGEESQPGQENKNASKRYIPEHKKPDAALTFPEKLMNMMRFADKHPKDFCISWLPDGKSFIIRHPDEFTRKVLPKFFKATKFSSFTRKLYRWGFRQVNRGIGPDDPIIFGNEYFQRGDAELMVKMRSTTAAGTRKVHTVDVLPEFGRNRTLDEIDQEHHKRMLLERLYQEKAMGESLLGPSLQNLNLANALRPNVLSNHLTMGMMHKRLGAGFPHQSLLSQVQPSPLGMYLPPTSTQSSFSTASTADIVNAAINALRYAS